MLLRRDRSTPTAVDPPRGLTAAFAGVGTVRDGAVVDDADFRILADGSASIGGGDVAGLDETRVAADAECGLLQPRDDAEACFTKACLR